MKKPINPWFRATITNLSKKEKWAFRKRHGRFDLYEYFNAILEQYWEWKDGGIRTKMKRKIAELTGVNLRNNQRLMHLLINATSQRDRQTRSRWATGLAFVDKQRVDFERGGANRFWHRWYSISNCSLKNPKTRSGKEMENYDKKFPKKGSGGR